MSDIPAFPYSLLWGERRVVSIANLTRADGEAFLAVAPTVPVHTVAVPYPLADANSALNSLRAGILNGAAVLTWDDTMAIQFDSRIDAARRLAKALANYRGRNPLVLAIPRGAVGMGKVLADELGGELDVVLVRKLRSPFSPELAVGAIDESGWTYVADHAGRSGADAAYLEREKQAQLETLRKRRLQYTPARLPIDPKHRIVIVVDDGLATGASMIAALHAVRARQPARLICAVPVAAPDSLERIRPYADEVACLAAPTEFHAVAQFYREFPQVEDEEVVTVLAQRAKKHAASKP